MTTMHGSIRLLACATLAGVALTACTSSEAPEAVDDPVASTPEDPGTDEPTASESTATEPPEPIRFDSAAGTAYLDGCEVHALESPDEDGTHHAPEEAPPADELYAAQANRPAHSGPHFASFLPELRPVLPIEQLEERAFVHNMEHGSIVLAVAVDHPDLEAILGWVDELSAVNVGRVGAGIYLTAWPTPAPDTVSLRAWGTALDCTGFDTDGATTFVFEHYGTQGVAPEGFFAPFPFERFEDTSTT